MSYHERPNLPGYWSYAGRAVQADIETHKYAVEYVSKNFPIGTPVLDLAAGQGALSKARLDTGYVVACTSWNDKVDLPIQTFKLNLDLLFSPVDVGQRCYPVICGIEIIEHLESPAQFLRSCRNILEENDRSFYQHLMCNPPKQEFSGLFEDAQPYL